MTDRGVMVSVVVPTYNRRHLLKRALWSLDSQTYRDFEVIVVNDGGDEVNDIVWDYPRANLINHERNLGLAAARNTGILDASGKYLCYLDDDDEYFDNHLEVLVSTLEGSDYGVAYTDAWYEYDDEGGKRVREMSRTFDRHMIKEQNITPCMCLMHERRILDQVGLFDVTLENHEDWDMWIRMSEYYDFRHVPQITAVYHKHKMGMSADYVGHRAGYWDIRVRYGTAIYG